jgi:peptide/nickel transport system substrate-binding protein
MIFFNNKKDLKTPMGKSIKVVLVLTVLCSLISCGSTSKKSADSTSLFPRDKTLYVVGIQWGDPTTFNPLDQNPSFPVWFPSNLMYEHLVIHNTLTNKIEPLIAKSCTRTGEVISFVLNPTARWSDGTPLTSTDVKFSYEIGKRYEEAPYGYIWDFIDKITVDTVSDSGGKAERVNFYIGKKEDNPLQIMDVIIQTCIMPSHVMEAKIKACNNDFSKLLLDKMDKNPVASGPYILSSYSNEKIVCKRRDDYWGNAALHQNRMPKPEFIIHPIFKSNEHFSIAIQKGELDFSSNYMPRIWLKAKSGVRTWFSKAPYFVPAVIPMITINCSRYPLTDKTFRRAMAYAIDYKSVNELAFDGYSSDLKPGILLPFGNEKKYYFEEDVRKYGATYDIAMAKKLLADAGYKSIFDEDGKLDHMVNAKGEEIQTMYIKVPTGWSDFEAMVKLTVHDLRTAGIDVREGACDESLYYQAQMVGDFDLFMDTPAGTLSPSMPWSRFQAVMSSRAWKPVGQRMTENYGRYNNPKSPDYNKAVDSLIRVLPGLTDEKKIIAAYRELNVIFMQDQPALTLVYRPEYFYEFSDRKWSNFPTEENPYAPPQAPCFGAGRNILWEITFNKQGM